MYEAFTMLKAGNIIKEKSGISIAYKEYDLTNKNHNHWHNYYTIDIILSGQGTHHLNGSDYLIKKGDITLVKPTDIHSVYTNTEMDAISICFTHNAIDDKYLHLLHYPTTAHHLSEEDLHRATIYCKSMNRCNEILQEHPDDALYLDELQLNFRLVLLLLAHQLDASLVNSVNRVSRITQYLNMHFREHLPLAQISAIAGLSPAYFSSWFKKNVGVSYIEYINVLRVDYACSMLNKGYSVTESCYGSGFSSISHFNHTFKNMLKINPYEFKNQTRIPSTN